MDHGDFRLVLAIANKLFDYFGHKMDKPKSKSQEPNQSYSEKVKV